ncbi:MAG: hypothetical protein QM784_23935 [Polyangiaceae bacterium]
MTTLRAEFLETFAGGTCLTAKTGKLGNIGSELRRSLGSLLLVVASQPAAVRTRRGLPVVVYRPCGRTLALFVVPGSIAREATFASFARKVSNASISETLAGIRSQ